MLFLTVEVQNSSKHLQLSSSGPFYAPLVRINNIYFIFLALWLSLYELNVTLYQAFLIIQPRNATLRPSEAPSKLVFFFCLNPVKSDPNVPISSSAESLHFSPKNLPPPQPLGFKGTIHLIQRSRAYCFYLIAAKLAAITVSTVDYCCL